MEKVSVSKSELALLESCKYAIEQIANIDTSFLNALGDEENYSVEEELKRIHQIATPIFSKIVEFEVDKKDAENAI